VAYHEAGHAVVSWFLEHCEPLLKVGRGGLLGAAVARPAGLAQPGRLPARGSRTGPARRRAAAHAGACRPAPWPAGQHRAARQRRAGLCAVPAQREPAADARADAGQDLRHAGRPRGRAGAAARPRTCRPAHLRPFAPLPLAFSQAARHGRLTLFAAVCLLAWPGLLHGRTTRHTVVAARHCGPRTHPAPACALPGHDRPDLHGRAERPGARHADDLRASRGVRHEREGAPAGRPGGGQGGLGGGKAVHGAAPPLAHVRAQPAQRSAPTRRRVPLPGAPGALATRCPPASARAPLGRAHHGDAPRCACVPRRWGFCRSRRAVTS
jgi:hypothetical protein